MALTKKIPAEQRKNISLIVPFILRLRKKMVDVPKLQDERQDPNVKCPKSLKNVRREVKVRRVFEFSIEFFVKYTDFDEGRFQTEWKT